MKTSVENISAGPADMSKPPVPVTYRVTSPNIELRRRFRAFQIERLLLRLYGNLEVTERYRRDDVDPRTVLAQVARKRLVFAVTAGRTGTVFLAKLLELIPDCSAHHEPEPAFQRYLRRVQADPRIADEFLLKYKLPFIADLPQSIYIELSNVFCKGFLAPLINLGIVPDLVILRRAPRKIAVSYLERYTVPGRTKYGLEFLVHPDDPGVMPLPGWRRMSDYQLCFWYALEIERRQAYYSGLVRDLGRYVVDITAEEVNDPNRFVEMVRGLGLAESETDIEALRRGHGNVARVEHNKNPQQIHIEGDLAAEEEVIWEAISRFEPTLRRSVERRYGRPK
jgi:hypothetical protein